MITVYSHPKEKKEHDTTATTTNKITTPSKLMEFADIKKYNRTTKNDEDNNWGLRNIEKQYFFHNFSYNVVIMQNC